MPANELIDGLLAGEMEIVGRMPRSSNATFLVEFAGIDAAGNASTMRGIYKPLRGERPLWDFEPGLHRREVAAYRLSESLGFGIVPFTVLRDGPYGEGSVQFFVDCDPAEHYFTIFENRPECHDRLRQICAFDIIANNTDRKSGHCILDTHNVVWAIDHGVSFSADFKLRTVIWEFGGEALGDAITAAIAPLAVSVPLDIAALLSDDEIDALQQRAEWLLEGGHFPVDPTGSRYPWPLV
jgi:uncharacterized repeat protein (TIGR03843 family)